MTEEPYQIPEHWAWTTLKDVRVKDSPTITKKVIRPDKYPQDKFELYSVPSYDKGKPEILFGKDIGSSKKIVEKDAVLLCKINPRINRVWIVGDYSGHEKIASTEWIIFYKREGIFPKYLQHYMKTPHFRSYLTMNVSGVGGSLMRTNASIVEEYPFPLAPYNEQVRIVGRVEELLSRLDAGVRSLQVAQTRLEQYWQVTLRQAYTGKLTQKCRRKKGFNDAEETIPNYWNLKKIKSIGEVITGTTPKKSVDDYYGDDYNFYKPTDLDAGYYVEKSNDNLSTIGITKARLLPPKSTLITCIGATIGKTGFIRKEGASNQQINAIVPNDDILPEFVYFMAISPDFYKQIIENASQTTLPIINKSKFEELIIPVPPTAEQKEIVKLLEMNYELNIKINIEIRNNIQRSNRLKQSFLKKAFEGHLAPQNPEDEPASILLERIKAQKPRKLKQRRLS